MMPDRQQPHHDQNHCPFQNHKSHLIISQLPLEPVSQFNAAKHRPHKNRQRHPHHRPQEYVKTLCLPQFHKLSLASEIRLPCLTTDFPGKLCAQHPKRLKLKTCHATPATMMLMPSFVIRSSVAREAMAPPVAWRRRAMTSQVMKRRVYVRGLKRDMLDE